MSEIFEIANRLVASGKGILAADESIDTIQKRFDNVGVENTEENRRIYRELLFTTPDIEKYISGVIMFEESLWQNAGDGRAFVKVLEDKGIIPGIKVDKGKVPLVGSPQEFVTEGLDGLRDRLKNFYEKGARFTKWRAVISIGQGLPTKNAIHANAHALARYAALVQEANMVPIVEPEVLMDGEHDIEECAIVTSMALDELFEELYIAKVNLKGLLLKPNMIVSGMSAQAQATPEQVAETTLEVFRRSVPSEVAGIVFLSGGQSQASASKNLCEMNREGRGSRPWPMSFSFGRALQNKPLEIWSGNGERWPAAQEAFLAAAKTDAEASTGVC